MRRIVFQVFKREYQRSVQESYGKYANLKRKIRIVREISERECEKEFKSVY
jgi:hypothetical protein